MRIPQFSSIVQSSMEDHVLKNCNLVVDAQNFFYNCYKDSGLPFKFGAECDRYAQYLRKYLSMFKNANIKCYFIFKGGTKDLERKIIKFQNGHSECKIIEPNFMIEVHLQVLKEMEFDYIFTEFESKLDCVAVAHKLSCPVVSQDIEFGLRGVQYVTSTSFSADNDKITCKLFKLEKLLKKYKLDRNKMAIFILLTDEYVFPKYSFKSFFESTFRSYNYSTLYLSLFEYLSASTEREILKRIVFKSTLEKDQILNKFNALKKFVRSDVPHTMVNKYLLYREEIPDWFVKGVAFQHIAKEYVDMYRSQEYLKMLHKIDCHFINFSLNIIKYAYDLLTGFTNEGFKFTCVASSLQAKRTILIKDSIKKPTCISDTSVFNEGWDKIHALGLFQHFIKEEIHFDCDKLDKVPDEAKILMITLIYICRKSNMRSFTPEMAYVVILCYIVLGVGHNNLVGSNDAVTICDRETVRHSLDDYFSVRNSDESIDEDMLNPLMEFQNCLLNMNYLNKLCGSPYKETVYSKTYNGTFVYSVLNKMQNEDKNLLVNRILRSSPTVLDYYKHITELFDELVN